MCFDSAEVSSPVYQGDLLSILGVSCSLLAVAIVLHLKAVLIRGFCCWLLDLRPPCSYSGERN